MESQSMTCILVHAAVNGGTPILLAALGEVIVERAGVLNLGIEGMMMVGALAGFAASRALAGAWWGLAAAAVVVGLFSLIHAFLAIDLRANQVVSGLALTILGCGAASFFGKSLVGRVAPRFEQYPLPFLSKLPFVGPAFFSHNHVVYLSYLLTFSLWFFLYRTRPGLELQFAGESPETADAAGVNVRRIRYLAVFAGGALAGIGGAYLSLADTPSWMDNMTAGRGWIAVAIVIFSAWDPLKASMGSYLFGGLVALQFRIQAFGYSVSTYLLKMVPYLATLTALVVTSALASGRFRFGAPAALGRPFDREARR